MITPHWSSLCRCAALFLTTVTVGWAQNGASQAGAKPQQSPETTPVFRTNADLVLVDVVVREKGKSVEGLKASDFHVAEDGAEQKITIFEEHKVTEAVQASRSPVLPAHVYSNFPQYAVTSAANVLLLDALNTPINDQKYARGADDQVSAQDSSGDADCGFHAGVAAADDPWIHDRPGLG